MATPMQKLMWPTMVQAYLRDGSSLLAGPAVRMADAMGWLSPAEVLAAYGVDAPVPPSVDVLRFEPSPVSQLRVPDAVSPTSMAGYASGFLRGPLTVPVWDIAPTEVPQGSELWRIFADGRQEFVSAYAGPAFGWRSTGVFVPPSMLVGPRAEWRGAEYVASWPDAAQVELVMYGDVAPDGFEQTRPNVFRRLVAAAECSRLFENQFEAMWNGVVSCRVVQSSREEAAVLLSVDAERALSMGAVALEPGLFWKTVPRSELSNVRGTSTELVASRKA